MVLFTLLLNRPHVFANFMFDLNREIWQWKEQSLCHGKWFEPSGISYFFGVIVRVREVIFRKTVVGIKWSYVSYFVRAFILYGCLAPWVTKHVTVFHKFKCIINHSSFHHISLSQRVGTQNTLIALFITLLHYYWRDFFFPLFQTLFGLRKIAVSKGLEWLMHKCW